MVVASTNIMRLSLKKGAHAALSDAAWQEIRVSRPESPQEHLSTSIAEVLRLRAFKPSVCDRPAKRFAQDDGFVGGFAENTKRSKKSRALGMTKERATVA
jgi:hypothetical protein